jgi:hypothetical protein
MIYFYFSYVFKSVFFRFFSETMTASSAALAAPSPSRRWWLCGRGGGARFLMLGLCLVCLSALWSNILAFDFALVCITAVSPPTDAVYEVLAPANRLYFTSAVAAAALVANFGTVPLVRRFSTFHLFFLFCKLM